MAFFTKHYNEIARIIRDSSDHSFTASLRVRMAQLFAADFARTNPQFDQIRFITACGVNRVEDTD